MTGVGFATLDVIPSMKGLRAQLERQANPELASAGKRGGELFGDAAGKAAGGRFKSKFGALAKDAFAPVAGLLAGAAVVDFFKDAITGASDLAESGNKVTTIFGEASSQVEDFAGRGAKALGQTKLQILDAAASFGTFGKAAGLTGNDLAGFSTKLVGLSTDMASFFNTSPDQAIQAIGAALRGEAEPIRAYGVLLDDATLRQEAMRQGLIKTTKEALTPQQKVLAAYQVILQQTVDAQGDFQRTSGGLANQQRILSAQWAEMKTEVGTHLLPAVTQLVTVMNNGLIPAVSTAGGVVADAVGAFNGLPGPVKAATGALIAFRVAQATGITTTFASGVGSLSKGLEDVRLRAMLTADQFRTLRSGTLELNGQVGKFTPGVGRLSASMGALKTSAAGAGGALKSGLSGAIGILGGPWGIALAAGTVAVTHFWQEHQKAKAEVESFISTHDAETGALTAQSRQAAAKQLLDSGALDAAKKLGIELNVVTDATLGNVDAQRQLLEVLSKSGDSNAKFDLVTGISQAGGTASKAQDQFKLLAEAQKDVGAAASTTASATSRGSASLDVYAARASKAQAALQKLLDTENKRRLAFSQEKRDRIALLDTLAAARKEARDGKRTLDENTQAGRDNFKALLDVADQWNQTAPKVRNARGAYAEMRHSFIDVAVEMGKTRDQAKQLADRILEVPKTAPVKFQSEGYQETLAQIKRLQAVGEIAIKVRIQHVQDQVGGRVPAFASGGKVGGSGTGDTRLILADPREWVINPKASSYYGDDFLRRLNTMQIPRVQAVRQTTTDAGTPRTSAGGDGRKVDVHLHVTADSGQQVRVVRAVMRDDESVTRSHSNMYAGGERG